MLKTKNIFKYAIYSGLTFSGIFFSSRVEDKNIRMGIVGLLGQVTTDFIFHPLELVNARTKYFFKEKINALDMSRRIMSTTGFSGFFRGGSITLLGSSFNGFIYFAFYKKFKEFFTKIFATNNNNEINKDKDKDNGKDNFDINLNNTENDKSSNFVVYTLSSIAAELVIYPLYYPFDLIKTRIQIGQNAYFNFFDGVKQILEKSEREGYGKIRDLYVGFTPCLMLNICGTFLTFFTFEVSRDYFAKKQNIPAEEIKGLQYFLCSFMAGFVTASSLNFLEVYSIQKVALGKEITFRKFLSVKNLDAIKSGMLIKMGSGILYTIFILESVNLYGKIFKVNL